MNTDDVPPTDHSVSRETVMRPDEPRPSSSGEDVLSNAPRLEGELFRVKVVLDE